MSGAEVCQLARNLARNTGWAVFPVGKDKKPTTDHGFYEAETDPEAITKLWRNRPGPLIGVATGARSGISVLDVDTGDWAKGEKSAIIEKHDAARAWWQQNAHRIPLTRIYGTRSGGLHLLFQHRNGVGVTQSVIHQGIDTRGDGGYMVFWFGAGFPCHRPEPPAPWPDWLYDPLIPKLEPKPAPVSRRSGTFKLNAERVIDTAERLVTSALEGAKHERVRKAARLLGGIAHTAGITEEFAVSLLLSRLPDTAKDLRNAEKTARWGFVKGQQTPLERA